MGSDSYGSGKIVSTLIKLATDDQKIVADITKRILLGESLEDIWYRNWENLDYLRILLEKFHIDPNMKSKYDYTQLMWASSNNRLDVVQCLLEHEADPNTQTKYGETALQYAHTKEMKELLKQYGAKPREELRKTSAIQDDQKIVADITKRILLGESLEDIWTDETPNVNYLRVLLEKFHVDPNIKDKYGEAALSWACGHGYLDVVKFLLEHGADPNTTDVNGDTILDTCQDSEIRELLKQYGGTSIHF